jgi:hypothetical protein
LHAISLFVMPEISITFFLTIHSWSPVYKIT